MASRVADAARTAVTLVAAAALFGSGAYWNGWPLLSSDSIEYLESGHRVAKRLFSGTAHEWYGQRSPLYGLLLHGLHRDRSLWPVVMAQGLALAYPLWLSYRVTLGSTRRLRFLALIALLALLTGASWYVALLMPDVFAPILLLGSFLLVFGADVLRAVERIAIGALVCVAIVVHTSHLLVAPVLMSGGMMMVWVRERSARAGLRAGSRLLVPLAAAVALLFAANLRLHGEPVLMGPHPPFLLARVVADGTAAPYLAHACATRRFALRDRLDQLPQPSSYFLWDREGILKSAPPSVARRIRTEEAAVVLGSVRYQPCAQLVASAKNWVEQLLFFGLRDFRSHAYVENRIAEVWLAGAEHYAATRQHADTLQRTTIARLHYGVVLAAALACAVLGWRLRRSAHARLLEFSVWIAAALAVNAAVTGILSGPADRYHGRVVWLVPWLACLLASAEAEKRRHRWSSSE